MVNGIDSMAVTNLDGLDSLATLKICVGYRLDGKEVSVPPADADKLGRCEPIYIEMPGWQVSTSETQRYDELPQAARDYLDKIAKLSETVIGIVSVGPERKQTVIR
jgi:adenylosuccinate synthase